MEHNESKLLELQKEIDRLKNMIGSESVFWTLRHVIKNQPDLGFEDLDESNYIELYDECCKILVERRD